MAFNDGYNKQKNDATSPHEREEEARRWMSLTSLLETLDGISTDYGDVQLIIELNFIQIDSEDLLA